MKHHFFVHVIFLCFAFKVEIFFNIVDLFQSAKAQMIFIYYCVSELYAWVELSI